MKRTWIWIICIIIGFSFLSLLYLQSRYAAAMVKMRREQFDESVFRSLNRAARDLERSETYKYLQSVLMQHAQEKAYMAHPDSLNPYSVDALLDAHGVMTRGLVEESGCFRSRPVGVVDKQGNILHDNLSADLKLFCQVSAGNSFCTLFQNRDQLLSAFFFILCAPTTQNMQTKPATTICPTTSSLICGSTLLQLLLNLPVMRWESTEFRPLFSLQSTFTAKQCLCFICGDSTRNITVSVLTNPFTLNNLKNKNSLQKQAVFFIVQSNIFCSFRRLYLLYPEVFLLLFRTPLWKQRCFRLC